jgi:hypothetical protein
VNALTWQVAALVLFLAALPLLALGTDTGTAPVWWAGLALLAAATTVPVVRRFADDDDSEG